MAQAVANKIPVLNLTKISTSVYNSKRKISLTNKVILNRTKSIQEDITVQKRLISENQSFIRKREELDERTKQEAILEAPDIIENKPARTQELLAQSNQGLFGRLLGFAGYLAAGWILTRLPELIKIGENFLVRLRTAKNIIGNFFTSTLLSLQSFGKLLGGIFTKISRLDILGGYESINTDFNELIGNVEKMGDSLYEAFSFIIDPLGLKIQERQQLRDAYMEEESSASGSVDSSITVRAGEIPPEGKALLDAIAGSEAGAAGYKSRFPSKSFNSFADHPRIDEPIPWRPGLTSNAAGRYQFLSTTWDGLARKLGLKDFSPENQDRAAWQLAIDAYGKGERGIIEDLRKNPLMVANKLSPTWTSLPGGAEQNAATSGFVSRFRSSVQKYSSNPAGVSSVNFEGQTTSANVIQTSSTETGSGYTIKGVKDASGRPVVFSRAAADAFYRMMVDSKGIVKGSDIASSQRSPEKNKFVGGVSGSKHLSGTAMDIHGASNSWIRRNGSKYGWYANDYDGSHGGHFEFKSSQRSSIPSTPTPTPKPSAQISRPVQQPTYNNITSERTGETYVVLDQRTPKTYSSQTNSGTFIVTNGGDDLAFAFNNNMKKRLLNDLSYV